MADNNNWKLVGQTPAKSSDPWQVVATTPAPPSGPDPEALLASVPRLAPAEKPGSNFASRAWALANHPLLTGEQLLPGLGLIEQGADAAHSYLAAHGHPELAKIFGGYSGAEKGVGDLASGATSPLGLGLAASGLSEAPLAETALTKLGVDPAIAAKVVPMAHRLMSLGFSAQNFAGAYKMYPQFRQAIANNDVETASRILTDAGGQLALGTLAALHGVAPAPKTAPVEMTPQQHAAAGVIDATHLIHPDTSEIQPFDETAPAHPEVLAQATGLIHKGEVIPGTGVHQFEHPDYPGITMAANAGELTSPERLSDMFNAHLAEMRANPGGNLIQAIIARGDAAQKPGSPIPADVQKRIGQNTQILRGLADPSKINSTDDVTAILQDASAKLAKNTDPRIAETMSRPLRQALARELGLSESDLLQMPIGQAANAETIEAARQLLANSRENVVQAAQEARANPGKLDDFLTALARHNEISGVVRGQVAREAGRSLQAFNEGDSGQGRTIDQAVRDLSAMNPDAQREAARRFALLDLNDPGAIERFAREVKPSSTADKLYELWMNSILTSAAIPAKIGGDLGQMFWGTLAKPVAGLIDMLRSAMTGAPRERYASEIAPFLYGHFAGAPEAVDRFVRTFKNEVGSVDSDNEFEPARIAIKGEAGRVIRIPSRLLAAVTDFFNAINYSSELHAQAYRTATQEGLRGAERIARTRELAANPTGDMKEAAGNFARTQTFQDNFQGSGWYNEAMREALKLKSNKLARWLFPFIKTPANILRENARISPAGIIGTLKGAITGDLKGGPFSDSAAKNVLGTAMFLWALRHALEGNITGAGPSDPRKRRALQATGWQAYSTRGADGSYRSFRRMVPVNFTLGAAADIADQLRANPNDPSIAGRIYSAITRTSKQVLDNPFLPTMADIASALQSSKRAAAFASYELIPGFVRDTAHMLDRTVRNPRTPAQEFEANLPGLTKRVPARVDASGQAVMRPKSQLGGFNPFPTSPARNDSVLSELARLGIGPENMPSRVVAPAKGTIKGSKRPSLNISGAEAEAITRQDSQMLHSELQRMMQNSRWASLPDNQKVAAIKRLRAKIAGTRYARVMQLRRQTSGTTDGGWRVVSETPAR